MPPKGMGTWGTFLIALFIVCGCDGGSNGRDGGQEPGPYAGDWQGLTSQSKPIVFRVAGNFVTYLRFEYQLSGSGCSVTGKHMRSISTPITGETFTVTDSSSGASSVVAGTFISASDATGTFSGSTSSGSCSTSGDATWQATKLPPAPSYDGTWTGQTSQGKRMSLGVSSNQVVSVTLEYVADDPCVTVTTFSGAPAGGAPIVAGQADFSHGRSPLMLSGVVTFSETGTAAGSLDILYYDTGSQPACTTSAKPTFSLQRE